jgi:DNA polymerase/3'-5' exonuclease PolX
MKTKMDLHTAQNLANILVETLRPFCSKIEVAGSTRRQKSTVGDIEIVAMPKDRKPIEFYAQILSAQPINHGEKYMKFVLSDGTQLDLFFVFDENQWGYILCQRTGPAEFNEYLFTKPSRGGIRPNGLKSIDGFIYLDGELQDTSTEQKFLACFGLDYISPEKRQGFDETDTQEYKDLIHSTKTPDPLIQCFELFAALFSKEPKHTETKRLVRQARLAGKQRHNMAVS